MIDGVIKEDYSGLHDKWLDQLASKKLEGIYGDADMFLPPVQEKELSHFRALASLVPESCDPIRHMASHLHCHHEAH
eukprot:8354155-Alexandrium_andersonii.AAC.1